MKRECRGNGEREREETNGWQGRGKLMGRERKSLMEGEMREREQGNVEGRDEGKEAIVIHGKKVR